MDLIISLLQDQNTLGKQANSRKSSLPREESQVTIATLPRWINIKLMVWSWNPLEMHLLV